MPLSGTVSSVLNFCFTASPLVDLHIQTRRSDAKTKKRVALRNALKFSAQRSSKGQHEIRTHSTIKTDSSDYPASSIFRERVDIRERHRIPSRCNVFRDSPSSSSPSSCD